LCTAPEETKELRGTWGKKNEKARWIGKKQKRESGLLGKRRRRTTKKEKK